MSFKFIYSTKREKSLFYSALVKLSAIILVLAMYSTLIIPF